MGIQQFLEKMGKAIKEYEESVNTVKKDKPVILTAAKIGALKWMSVPQLAAIYHYGKVKVKIDDDPEAYSQLKWLSAEQLAAIFGKEEQDT